MRVQLEQEQDPEVLRQALRILFNEVDLLTRALRKAYAENAQLKCSEQGHWVFEIQKLEAQIDALQKKIYGASSEQTPRAAAGADDDAAPSPPKAPQKGHGRKARPELPAVEMPLTEVAKVVAVHQLWRRACDVGRPGSVERRSGRDRAPDHRAYSQA